MHLSNMMDFYCRRGFRGKGWISALSEVSSAGIREMQKNLILCAPQFLDLIWEPQYCKKSQRPYSPTFQSILESWNLSVFLQVVGAHTPNNPLRKSSISFWLWRLMLLHPRFLWSLEGSKVDPCWVLMGKRVGCIAKASLFSRAISQVPAGGG